MGKLRSLTPIYFSPTNDDDNIFKRSAPDTIRFMSKEENPYINRADIIPDMSTFGTSRPGAITPDRAARLIKAHETAQAKRTEDHRLAGIVWDALETGSPLNPDDPDHIRTADTYFATEIMPNLIEVRTPEQITPFRGRINGHSEPGLHQFRSQ